jgi:putative acetyltransferase
MNAALTIRDAVAADLEDVRTLFREYAAWLGIDLCFQGFDQELAMLPGRYAPPAGRLLLAELDGRLAGVIGLRDLSDGVCEMKRLYVRDFARGHGAGRALAERLVAEAKAAGYRAMRLDTLRSDMPRANALYESLGFREIDAYYHNPVAGVRYMELDLAS